MRSNDTSLKQLSNSEQSSDQFQQQQQQLQRSALKTAEKYQNKKLELQQDLEALRKKEKDYLIALQQTNVALEDLGIPSSLLYPNSDNNNNITNAPAVPSSSSSSSSSVSPVLTKRLLEKLQKVKSSGLMSFKGDVKQEGWNDRSSSRKEESRSSREEFLSFRGEDKVREYFQKLDFNHDGYLDYETFRGKKSRSTFPLFPTSFNPLLLGLNSLRHPYGLVTDPAYQSR